MSDKSFNGLVKTVVERLGIDRTGKNTSNQSLRTSTFNAQVNIVHKWQFAVHFSSYFFRTSWALLLPKRGWSRAISVRRQLIFTLGKLFIEFYSFLATFICSQNVEQMAQLGGLMAALVSGAL